MENINLKQTIKYILFIIIFFRLGNLVFISLLGAMNIQVNYVYYLASEIIFYLMPTYYLLRKKKITLKRDLKIVKIPIKMYIHLIILAILFQPITHGLITLLSELLNDHSIQNYKYSFSTFIYSMITGAMITPLVEEICFRGLLFQKTKHIGIYKSILINGIIFGLIHQNVIVFSFTFLFGMLCCYVFYTSKSLIAPIFLHAMYNALQSIPDNKHTGSLLSIYQ
ncbi:type II CAAX endopeptidase family protein [Bacillus sp. JJ664]